MTTHLAAIRRELEFQRAALTPPDATRAFSVAGVGVEVRVHGAALADVLLPAFDACPAPEPGGDPYLIHAWDHHATGTEAPRELRALVDPGYSPRFVDGCNQLVVAEGAYGLVCEADDPPTALFTVDSAAMLPAFHRGSPLAILLASLLRRDGRAMVHSACVGQPGLGGLLLAGRSGSGKSTTALRALLAGWLYTGDDYVVADPGGLTAHTLYATAKLAQPDFDDASLVPPGAPLFADPQRRDKTIAQLWPAFRDQMPPSLPIRAVVATRVGHDARTTWRWGSAGGGLLALAPSTVLQLHTGSASGLTHLSHIARSVPSAQLELGSDPAGVLAALHEVLQEAGSR